jgi:hypothetical protein
MIASTAHLEEDSNHGATPGCSLEKLRPRSGQGRRVHRSSESRQLCSRVSIDSPVSGVGPKKPHADATIAHRSIIFCHGLGGHPYDTWACHRSDTAPRNERSRFDTAVPISADGYGSLGKRQRFLSKFRSLGLGSKSSENITQNGNDTWQSDTTLAFPNPETDQSCAIYWITDFLAEEKGLEHARILVYGYDSKVAKLYKNVNQNDFFAHAKNLMFALAREKPKRRPVIFVAHSLGGLLVKEVCPWLLYTWEAF